MSGKRPARAASTSAVKVAMPQRRGGKLPSRAMWRSLAGTFSRTREGCSAATSGRSTSSSDTITSAQVTDGGPLGFRATSPGPPLVPQLRPAQTADIPRLVEIRAAVRENRLVGVTIGPDDYRPYVEDARCWVAEADGAVQAFAALDA